MTGTQYPILGIISFHQMGVLQAFFASRQAHAQFAQLADVLDAAYVALGMPTVARSAAVSPAVAPAPFQHSLPPVLIPASSYRSM